MKSLVANLQRLSLALLAVFVVVFGSFTVLTPTASASIYVGNLDHEITADTLEDIFSKYGAVKRVQLPTDRETGAKRGFGFVEMATESDEQKAVDALDGAEWMGRDLKVNLAKPSTGDRYNRGR